MLAISPETPAIAVEREYEIVCGMSEVFCSNPEHSTTRRVTLTAPIVGKPPDAKFECILFLPAHPQRKGEGGLRTRGYFKEGDCLAQSSPETISGQCPLFTIITVVLNGAKTLERTILSVINQSYDNVEYLIIDGASTDGTLDILGKYGQSIDYWVSEPDGGIYDAWNKALKCASGDWICFLGGDDCFADKSVLSRIVPFIPGAYPPERLVYGSVAVANRQDELLYMLGEAWEVAKNKLGDVMSVPHTGMMHHRSWFEDFGVFDASYRISGDYEMLMRGWPAENALFIPDLVVVRMQQGGISSEPQNAIVQLREVRRAQKLHGIVLPGWRLMVAFFRVYTRLVLRAMFGERTTYRILDLGRKLLGKKPYWTKV